MGQFQQQGHAGCIAVGPVVNAVHAFAIYRQSIRAQIVHTGAYYDIMAIQRFIPALQETHHIAGGQGVLALRQAELAPGGQDIYSVFFQFLRQVIGRHPFSFGTGFTPFQLGTGKIAHMRLEGPDRLRVIQIFQGGAILGA